MGITDSVEEEISAKGTMALFEMYHPAFLFALTKRLHFHTLKRGAMRPDNSGSVGRTLTLTDQFAALLTLDRRALLGLGLLRVPLCLLLPLTLEVTTGKVI